MKRKHSSSKPERTYTPDWINETTCGVSKSNLEKMFKFMHNQGYTATRDLKGCTCMDASIEICCTNDMIDREPLCSRCAHECSDCHEPNLQFFKSKKGNPVCYTCAGYFYGAKKVWWEDDDWIKYKKRKTQEESSSGT